MHIYQQICTYILTFLVKVDNDEVAPSLINGFIFNNKYYLYILIYIYIYIYIYNNNIRI